VPLGRIARTRNGAIIDEYALYRIDSPTNDALSFGTAAQ
jgi:hypothetical protein